MKPAHRSLALSMLAALAVSNADADTRVNAAHFAPFAANLADTAVSIDVNGGEVLSGVEFNQVSGYLSLTGPGVAPGSTLVEVFAPPGAATPAISGTFDLAADTDYTLAAIGNGTEQPLALLPLVDDNTPPAAGNVKLRVVHAAPFASTPSATAVSVRTQAGDLVDGLASVSFGQSSDYFEVPAGTYDLKIATPDGSTTLIDPAPVTLAAGTIATLFAVGDGAHRPLGITAVFGDGSSASLPLSATGTGGGAEPAPTLATWAALLMGAALVAIALAFRRRATIRP